MLLGGRVGRVGEQRAAEHLRTQVADEVLRKTLTPDYPIGCKRVVISNDYYPALTRDNVEVVTEPIRAIRRGRDSLRRMGPTGPSTRSSTAPVSAPPNSSLRSR
jgi:Predicted flavoprotein involved in K+ transport